MPATGEIYNPFRVFKGSFIPNAVLKCRDLSATSKLVFGRLCQYAGEDGEAYPSYSTIGREIGIERRQTIRSVRELEDFGLIRAVPRRKGDGGLSSNSYVFLWHRIFSEGGSPPPGVISDTRGSVAHDTTLQCHPRHQVVSAMTPKENQTRDQSVKKTTTEQIRLLLSGTPLFEVSAPELLGLITRHGLERLSLVADVAAEIWRQERKEVRNPGGYLHSLCINLIIPSWYEPRDLRKAKAEATEERKRVAKELAEQMKAEAEKVTQEKDDFWFSLTDADKERFRTEVTASMTPGFNWPAMAITALAKTLAWKSRSGMHTNGLSAQQ
jgi:Helix-turn-helix domain